MLPSARYLEVREKVLIITATWKSVNLSHFFLPSALPPQKKQNKPTHPTVDISADIFFLSVKCEWLLVVKAVAVAAVLVSIMVALSDC